MKKKEKTKVAKYLANELNLAHHGVLAYRVVSHNGFKCIVGILVDTISFKPEGFRLMTFSQCPYAPWETFDLSLGGLNYIDGVPDDFNSPDFNKKVLSTYKRFDSIVELKDVIDVLQKNIIPYSGNITTKWEIIAYTYIIINQDKYALNYLDMIIQFENEDNSLYIHERALRAKTIKGYLLSGEREKALDTLRQWQDYTINALKLTDII